MCVLSVLQNLPSNALVESRFSTAAQAKSSYRMNLGGGRLAGTIMTRDEQAFEEVQFPELLREMLPTVAPSLKRILGARGKHAHSEAFKAKKKQKIGG